MQIRIDPKNEQPLKELAKLGRRSQTQEANIAIEAHIEANSATFTTSAKKRKPARP